MKDWHDVHGGVSIKSIEKDREYNVLAVPNGNTRFFERGLFGFPFAG